MNSFQPVLAIFLLAFVCSAIAERCIPGESFMKDCNYCTCSPDGKLAACTLMACYQDSKRMLRSSECVPGEQFKQDCNDCTCSPDGRKASCTLKDCKTKRSIPTPEEKCTPGTTWKEDCNSCFCTDSGVAACTLMGCLGPGTRPIVIPGQN